MGMQSGNTKPMAGGDEVGGAGEPRKVLGKRPAEHDSIGDHERFHKRFNLLSIGARGPSRESALPSDRAASAANNAYAHSRSNYSIPVSNALTKDQQTYDHGEPLEDLMHVEDTRDRVFVHNLDEELAEIESSSDEERLIFLPDIEKRFNRIPKHILTEKRDEDDDGSRKQELVLYSIPKLLTAQDGHDSVRRAILEARQRARVKAVEEARQEDMARRYEHGEQSGSTEMAHGYSAGYAEKHEQERDPDSMEID